MIRYDTEATYMLVFGWQGSVYKKAVKRALPAVLMTALFIVWKEYHPESMNSDGFQNEFAYSVFTYLLGFIVIFRCNLAYSRFWEGRNSIEKMTNCWIDASIKCITFDNFKNKNPPENVRLWRLKMLGLFSLLHGTALSTLANFSLNNPMEIFEGIDPKVEDTLNMVSVKDRAYLVYTWIQEELLERMADGGLQAPPPIVTRIWQDLTNGMQGFNDADMIDDTPFPFPYSQIISILLLLLATTSGYVMMVFVENYYWVLFLTGTVVGTFHALNEVAKELEIPYGEDANDLPMTEYQDCFNNRMQQLLFLGEDIFECPGVSAAAERHAEMNKNVSMDEQVKKVEPPKPAPTPPVLAFTGTMSRSCWDGAIPAIMPTYTPHSPPSSPSSPPRPAGQGLAGLPAGFAEADEYGVDLEEMYPTGRPTYDNYETRDDKRLEMTWQRLLHAEDPAFGDVLKRVDMRDTGEVH